MASTDQRTQTLLPIGRVRTPVVLQMDNAECGAACLGIILAYHGRFVPLERLRQDCGVSRDGSKAGNILRAAQLHGLKGKGLKKDLRGLRDLAYPYIAFWNFNHFVVVEGCRDGGVWLNDPAVGPRKVPFDEFDQCYTGVVLTLEPSDAFQKGGRKPDETLAVLRRLSTCLDGLFFCVLAGLVALLPNLAIAALVRAFIDDVLIAGRQEWSRPIALGIIAAVALRLSISALQASILLKLRHKLATTGAAEFLLHLLRLPPGFYSQRHSAEIADRVWATDRIAEALSGNLAQALISLVVVIVYAAVMALLDVSLTLIALAFAIGTLITVRRLAAGRQVANLRLGTDGGRFLSLSLAGLQGIRVLKASGQESMFFARWAGVFTRITTASQDLVMTGRTLAIAPVFLRSLMTLAILTVGGLRVMDGTLTLGVLLAIQILANNILDPVGALAQLAATNEGLRRDTARLDDVLKYEAAAELNGSVFLPGARPMSRLSGAVELRDVTFAYDPIGAPVLTNFSMVAEPGRRIALVGGSGSGKSSVLRLIAGLYQATQGQILLDGTPISSVPRTLRASSLALVEQDPVLFGGTVRDNLTMWDPTISDSAVRRACEDAMIWNTVRMLPGGLDARLSESGSNLSGGERQRLELARALAANPSILLLDEATSSLDAETEWMIMEHLRQRSCTCIVAAHRLSTVRDSHQILVLRRGQIVQTGTHQTLASEEGEYCNLLGTDHAAA